MPLPAEFYRCVGHRQIVQYPLERIHPICNHCRRREPGHERGQWLSPDVAGLAAGGCLNFIPPKD